ncbi:hypothetical protein Esti_001274 [Eimeria stiedai]
MTGSSSKTKPEAATLADAAKTAEPHSAPSAAAPAEPQEKTSPAVDSETKGRGVVYVAQLPHGWTRLQVIRYFERRKRHAKRVVGMLDGQPVGGKKRSKHAQDLLMLSYLKNFNFSSLYEDAMHVKRTRQDRLNAQMARVKKESQMYVELLEHKHSAEQLRQRISKKNEKQEEQPDDEEAAVPVFPLSAAMKPRNDAAKRRRRDADASGPPNKKKVDETLGTASVSRSLLKRLAA